LQQKIARKAGNLSGRHQLKPMYRELLDMVEAVSVFATQLAGNLEKKRKTHRYALFDDAVAQALIEELRHYVGLGARVIDQARRRVLQGESVPNNEKIFSIFEPHTELLQRGKAGKPVEFGHMIQIQQVRQKFITEYEAFQKKPVEHQLLQPALKHHRRLFGEDPDELTADKGYYESVDALASLREKIDVVAIGKKGNRTPEETERESDPAFRHAQRFRAGVEGTISFLKRVLGLLRCFNKGWDHFAATVGVTVFSHNLLTLARG
jgi:IS5 family transposase